MGYRGSLLTRQGLLTPTVAEEAIDYEDRDADDEENP